MYAHFLKFLIIITLSSLIFGCGYKPSAKYARSVMGSKISTSVVISSQDPENTVLIKDAVDSAIIEIFHASLVDKKYSDTHLTLKITEPSYAPLQYNNNGFVVSYRATIQLIINRYSKGVHKMYRTNGTYDFAVVPNAVLTDQERFDAIKFSATKAISAFVAQVSMEGLRK